MKRTIFPAVAPLALVVCALVVGSAAAASTATLNVRTKGLYAQLRLEASSLKARTTVTVRGPVRVTARRSRLVLRRCLNRGCTKRSPRYIARRTLRRGRRTLTAHLSTIRTSLVRVELRVGKRVLASRLLKPRLAQAPITASLPAAAAPAPPSPSPAPSDFSLKTNPGLTPPYSPAISDYTIRCAARDTVEVSAVVPSNQSLVIDGTPAGDGPITAAVGLEPDQAFTFAVDDDSGVHTHHVRCVPDDFPAWLVERNGTPDLEWLVFTPLFGGGPYSIIADNYGVPVWWKRATVGAPQDAKVLPDGTVVWGRWLSGTFGQTAYERYELDGTPLGQLSTVGVGADFHDIQRLPDGNYLMVAYRERAGVDLSSQGGPVSATVLDAEIQEVSAAGDLVWSWNSSDHINLAETASWGLEKVPGSDGQPVYDIVHINSVEQTGDTIVFSARNLNAVYGIRRSDGAVEWKLGGTIRPESLTLVGDPLASVSFGGQHDARILPDGTLTIHDNGTQRSRPPRAVRYELDTAAGTATLVEQINDGRVADSLCCGSARRLPGGHWVMSWGAAGIVTELTGTGEPVLSLTLASGFSYRAQPISPGVLERATLRAGMNAMHPR